MDNRRLTIIDDSQAFLLREIVVLVRLRLYTRAYLTYIRGRSVTLVIARNNPFDTYIFRRLNRYYLIA